MPRPSVQSLHESEEYRFVESFTIDEMPQFLAREAGFVKVPGPEESGKKGTPKRWLLGMLLFFGAAFGVLLGFSINNTISQSRVPVVGQIAMGVVGLFLVVLPLHEGIHALFFKILGARQVGFGYSKKGMMVYAYAQRFVMTLRENALVAAMPFIFITIALVGLVMFLPGLKAAWIILLLLHTLGCMGDFILIAHAWKNRKAGMYTYDDLSEKRTYFFERQ